jgi:elongation factor G
MKDYPTERLRNVVVIGHSGTGKTTFSEAALFASGAITRQGRVDDGNTVSDHDPDEIRRQISISLSVLPCEWNGHKINIIDTPGYADFLGEVKQGVRSADSAIVLVDAVSGVEVGTDLAWSNADDEGLPRMIVINRIDRENADFESAVRQIQDRFGKRCIPLHLPVGQHEAFQGVVDILETKSFVGEKGMPADVPETLSSDVSAYREQLVEAIAETNDDLLGKFLEGEELTTDELRGALHAAVAGGAIVPVLVCAASKNIGVTAVLDMIVTSCPSPIDRGEIAAHDSSGAEIALKADAAGPLAVLVFKTTADAYVGKLSYLRVISGTLKADSQIFDANKKVDERIGQILQVRGKTQEQVSHLAAGDIGAVAKLAETETGNTLCTRDRPIVLEPIAFPKPSYSLAVYPKTKSDLDKLGTALARAVDEDRSLRVYRDTNTNETIISGLGESHIDVTAERMKRKFGIEVELITPKVPYRETITAASEAEFIHKKQSGGHGQYARVAIKLEPMPKGAGYEFVNKISGGAVPRQYIPAVEKGVQEAMSEGVLAHYPLIDMRVTLFDGKEHPVDSSEMAFRIAGSQALKKGVSEARPVLLEPIMTIRITAPDEHTGDILSDLNGKRGKVLGMTPQTGFTVIEAQVALAEVQRYATDLRSMTQGRAHYTMEISHYEEVPAHVAQKVIQSAEKAAAT